MLWLIYALGEVSPLYASASAQATPATSVTQQFRYHAPDAGEVYLVWGGNGWQLLAEEFRPPGTVVEFGVMNTPMAHVGEDFVAQLHLPVGTALIYGFQTRAKRDGTAIPWVWDGDYHQKVIKDDLITRKANVLLGQTPALRIDPDTPTVTQEFRYHAPEAGEVYLIWGINGWQLLPEALRPPDTTTETGVMHTAMTFQNDTFVAQVRVPAGMKLDYGFQTRKKSSGALIEWVWDGNYQRVPVQNEVISVEATITLTNAKEYPLDFTIGPYLLLGVSLLLALALLLRASLPGAALQSAWQPSLLIIHSGASLYLLLLVIRSNIVGFNWVSFHRSPHFIPAVVAASYYDLLYVSVFTTGCLGLFWLLRKHAKMQYSITWVYFVIAFLSLLIGFANIQVIRVLGRPINYQWLYYADFLTSSDAHNAIKANFTPGTLINGATLGVGFFVLTYFLQVSSRLLPAYRTPWAFSIIPLAPVFLSLVLLPWASHRLDHAYPKIANPIVFFLQSIQDAWSQPQLFTMPLNKADFVDFQPMETGPGMPEHYQTKGKIQNVVLFVMESVAAEYLEAYGGLYPVTPALNRHRQQTLLFNNIYAGAPASNYSLFSLLSGRYPWISYASLTQVKPALALSTLSSELKQHNYRTAFLSASDATFQRGDEFLTHQKFDTIRDYHTLNCTRKRIDLEWAYSDAVDELCLIDALEQWHGEQPTQPFFAMLWSMGTHYPYFVMDEEVDYGVGDKTFNRYLNAIYHTDKVIGQLIDWLDKHQLLDSTLLVVVGDHGEAFGRHQQIGHLEKIYEENVHVPLLLINPQLFHGEANSVIGGHLDIAPTILSLLNLPVPEAWQGQNLLNSQHRKRAYFFAATADFWFGYREDNLKFLFNATTNEHEIYDLAADPQETQNLVGQMPDYVPSAQQRLAAWVQYHNRYMEKLLNQ